MTLLQIDVTVTGPDSVLTGSTTVTVEDPAPAGEETRVQLRSQQMRWGGSPA